MFSTVEWGGGPPTSVNYFEEKGRRGTPVICQKKSAQKWCLGVKMPVLGVFRQNCPLGGRGYPQNLLGFFLLTKNTEHHYIIDALALAS